eukprot:GHVT01082090.1.p1 GENE.GHVT01082090.1~~GHVT01082090.1.p1  ORF type:complete len:104 (-),score=8.64 GHVT01082090.1:479-790(-)
MGSRDSEDTVTLAGQVINSAILLQNMPIDTSTEKHKPSADKADEEAARTQPELASWIRQLDAQAPEASAKQPLRFRCPTLVRLSVGEEESPMPETQQRNQGGS